MLRYCGRISIYCIIILLAANNVFSLSVDSVDPIDNRTYFTNLHTLFSQAKKSIKVIMFSARYYHGRFMSQTNMLIKDLIEARARNVDVEVRGCEAII